MPADHLVLIFDTHATSRTRLAARLNGLGYRALHADSLDSAGVAWEAEGRPVVIVAAHGRHPAAASQIARMREHLPDVTMIAIGERSLPAALGAWRAGADAYVPRPAPDPELLDALNWVDRMRAERAAAAARLRRIETRLTTIEAEQGAQATAQATAMVRRLALDLAHEINNPLTPILGLSEMLLEDLPAEHVGQEYARSIIDSALRIRNVVRRLIMFSQGEE